MSNGIWTTVHVDLSGATKKVSPASVTRGRIAMASQMMMDMDRYIPLRSGGGALRASASMGGSGETISYNTVYARAHYYGTNGIVTFKRYTTPGTGKNWLRRARSAHIDNWKQKALKEMGF
ncbi:TPA: minor capsid protein [Streptococcus agalactiae]|nr:capsid protein [Streptococcus agalactiae]HEN9347551.1 capsid protein [Streptococcus agalactiae]HEO2002349.1 capsid protein [Streptococcus agalactiae]HEO3105217.1 capsid protein [Streptococcus agalactiae]HEO3835159.1 capsid protein [Streptococcus agalactiae]